MQHAHGSDGGQKSPTSREERTGRRTATARQLGELRGEAVDIPMKMLRAMRQNRAVSVTI